MADSEKCVEIWMQEKEDLLVAAWQERPCLYIISSPEYADRNKKQLALKEIADEIGATGKLLLVTSELMVPERKPRFGNRLWSPNVM